MLVEIITGLGTALGISVGALLTEDMAGTELSGVGQSGAVVGGALMAVPASAVMQRFGRRPGLVLCYLVGATGGLAVLASAVWESLPLLFLGFFLFGAGNAGKLQARYTAVDLAVPERRGRQLSLVVWSTTIGAVIGPNLAAPLGSTLPGVPSLAAPFAFASLTFLVGALLVLLFLRPDPLLLASGRLASAPSVGAPAVADPAPPAPAKTISAAAATASPPTAPVSLVSPVSPGAASPGADRAGKTAPSLAAAWQAVLASPGARLGITATSIGHLVMVAVMAMTPLHIHDTHNDADTLRIVGFIISAHIAGMYGLSPVVGWLTDRLGRRVLILGGAAVLVAACALAGTSGHDTGRLAVALVLLGVGWSCTMVAGSTLFAESIPVAVKARAQGLSDLAMGLTGAGAGLLSGVVLGLSGYPVLTLLAALATVPLIALTLRPTPPENR